MLYTDAIFLLLLAAVWVVAKLLGPWPALKEWFLIAFSFFVIASWGYFDLALFFAVLFVNFWATIVIGKIPRDRGRPFLIGIIILDVATLAVFKYANFIGGNIGPLIGLKIPAFPLGIPLAISFYVFHLISYLVDLHARRVRIATVREYLFYLSFFPHVIAGPITRAWQLVPQIGRRRRVRGDFALGFHFLVTGFFLKMVAANNIAQIIDPFWAPDAPLVPLERWIVAVLYYCQIYGDFAGYSLMALGMARLLGYRLPANFRSPMRAASIQEFWGRWHITLSRWLRDYLYIPLGGNRVSPLHSAGNVLVTMLLGGLWHGAGWGFIIWGGMHGTGLVAERFFRFDRAARSKASRVAWGVLAQLWIIAAWVFFRLADPSSAFHFLRLMSHLTAARDYRVRPLLVFALIYALPVIAHNLFPLLMRAAGRKRLGFLLGASTGGMLLLNFIIFSPSAVFIYFRF